MGALQHRPDGDRELPSAGTTEIDSLANAALAGRLRLQFGNRFFASVVAMRTHRTVGQKWTPKFGPAAKLDFSGSGWGEKRQSHEQNKTETTQWKGVVRDRLPELFESPQAAGEDSQALVA